MRASSQSKTFSSPNYPSNYPNNLDVTWEITASPGYAIKLTFNPFYTETCCDYVQVKFFILKFKKKNPDLHYTRSITPKHVTSGGAAA